MAEDVRIEALRAVVIVETLVNEVNIHVARLRKLIEAEREGVADEPAQHGGT